MIALLVSILFVPCSKCFHPSTFNEWQNGAKPSPLCFWSGKCTVKVMQSRETVTTLAGQQVFDENKPTKISNKKPPVHQNPKRSRPRLAILEYEGDDGWVCINKPSGMTVHRGSQQTRRRELVVATTLKRQLSRKVFPVHRLDHRTSGVLIFAFSSEMASILHNALGDHNGCEKTYVALLRGDWDQYYKTEQITIDKPLKVHGIVKDAKTVFRKLAVGTIVSRSDDNTTKAVVGDNEDCYTSKTLACCTLVTANPLTGRTHQIRRHAATALGMPVIGDTQHGASKMNRWWRQQTGLNRLALHCLAVKHLNISSSSSFSPQPPRDIVAPLPDNLKSIFLQRHELALMWDAAVIKEPLLASEWIDNRGGTRGIVKDWQKP